MGSQKILVLKRPAKILKSLWYPISQPRQVSTDSHLTAHWSQNGVIGSNNLNRFG